MNEEKEMFDLDFEERALIVCLMDPIITWNNDDRLEELCQQMVAGSKGAIDDVDYKNYKVYTKKVLLNLTKRLGFE